MYKTASQTMAEIKRKVTREHNKKRKQDNMAFQRFNKEELDWVDKINKKE